MANNKYVEYQDPVTSMGINTSRRGFLPPGRYYGFDGYDGSKLTSSSDSLLQYTNHENALETSCVVVTKQGTVLFLDPDSDPLTLNIVNNQFQVVILSYSWVEQAGGSIPTWGTLATTPDEPLDPAHTSASAVEVPIGYFKYGVSGAATWVPYDKPNLAGKVLDFSNFAKLNEVNPFTKLNIWGYQSLDETSLVPDAGSETPNAYHLVLGDSGNVIRLNLDAVNDPVNITDIEVPNRDNGTVLYINIVHAPPESHWIPGASFILSRQGGKTALLIPSLRAIYTFVRVHDLWYLWDARYDQEILNDWLAGRISTNEGELLDHENRITALEESTISTLAWSNVTPADNPKLEFTYLQQAQDGDDLYLRGKITVLAGPKPVPGLVVSGNMLELAAFPNDTAFPCGVKDGSGGTFANVYLDGGILYLNFYPIGVTTLTWNTTVQFYGIVNKTLV